MKIVTVGLLILLGQVSTFFAGDDEAEYQQPDYFVDAAVLNKAFNGLAVSESQYRKRDAGSDIDFSSPVNCKVRRIQQSMERRIVRKIQRRRRPGF